MKRFDKIERISCKLDNLDYALKDNISDLKTFIRDNIYTKICELNSITALLIEKNQEMAERMDILANTYVCVCTMDNTRCAETSVLMYFCKKCDQSFPICNEHMRINRKTNLCSICDTQSMVRRFAIPLPQKNFDFKNKFIK